MKALHALAVIKDARDTGRLRAVYDVLDEIDACDFDLPRRCLCDFAGGGVGGCECARSCSRYFRYDRRIRLRVDGNGGVIAFETSTAGARWVAVDPAPDFVYTFAQGSFGSFGG